MAGVTRSARGLTLVELLVALGLVGLVLAGAVGLLHNALKSYGLGAARVEAQQSARLALERMVKELRDAGYDPTVALLPAIVAAEPTRVTFQRDLDGDGVIAPTRERVTYLLRGTVLRRDAGGGAQPIIEGVRRIAFTYFDRDGALTTDPDRVRSIQILLEAGLTGPGALLESQVTLRNPTP